MRKAVLKKAIIIGLAIGFISLIQANESKAAVKEIKCETVKKKCLIETKSGKYTRRNVKYKKRYFIIDKKTKTIKVKIKAKKYNKCSGVDGYDYTASIKNGYVVFKLTSLGLKGLDGCEFTVDRTDGAPCEQIIVGYPEAYVQSELSKAPKYNTFAEYPYKQNYDQVTNDPLYTYELEKWWSTMPQYIKDTLSYTKTKIKFTTSSAINGVGGLAFYDVRKGKSSIRLRNSKDKVSSLNHNLILHEAAHIYYGLMRNNPEFIINISKEYKADKEKYGSYGAKNQNEFHSEKVRCTNMIENNYYDDETLWDLILSDQRAQYYQYTSEYGTTHIACVGWIGASKYGMGKDSRIDSCKISDDYYTMYKSKIQEKFKAKGIPVEYVEIFDTKEEMEKWVLPINPGVQLQQVTIQ